MPFINPYQYGGGVKFNVHAVHELPTSAKSDDIYLVFPYDTQQKTRTFTPSNGTGSTSYLHCGVVKITPKTATAESVVCKDVSSGTTLSSSITCEVGDLIVAQIVVRSSLTLPNGWTLLRTIPAISGDSTSQTLSFAYKIATSTTETLTVTQSSSNRIYINLIRVKNADSIIYVSEAEKALQGNMISSEVLRSAGLYIWGVSSMSWSSTAPYGDWTYEPTTLSYSSLDDANYAPRLGTFVETLDDVEQPPLPDVSNIKALAVLDNFDKTLGNIYPDNTVVLFYKDNGTVGTNKLHYSTQNLSFNMPFASTIAVVNHDGQQVKCTVSVYNTETSEWQESSFVQLPILTGETLINWGNIDNLDSLEVWSKIGLAENAQTVADASKKIIEPLAWGVLTTAELNNLHAWNIQDSGSYTKNSDGQNEF